MRSLSREASCFDGGDYVTIFADSQRECFEILNANGAF